MGNNVAFSVTPLLSVYFWIKVSEGAFFALLTSRFIRSSTHVKHIAVVIALASICQSILAISQYVHQGSIGGLLYFFGERQFSPSTPGIANAAIDGTLVLRPYGTFSHPNVLAGYLLVTLLVIWQERKKVVIKLALFLGTVALFATLSRSAMLLWLVFVVVQLLQQREKRLSKKVIVVAGISCVVLFALFPVMQRLYSVFIFDEGIMLRINLLHASVSMITSQVLFGVGLGNFLVVLPQYISLQDGLKTLQPVHNIFALIMAETGIVGSAIVGYGLYATMRFVHSSRGSVNRKHHTFWLLSTVLVLGMVDHYWYTLQQGQLLVAFVLGLCWSHNNRKVQKRLS